MQGFLLNPTGEASAPEVGEQSSCGNQYYQEPEDVLIGREDAEKKLVFRLFDVDMENLRVISVVDKEALGKTALVRHVYKRLDIRQHFQCRVWLHVCKEFTHKDLLIMILKQIPIHKLVDVELMREEELRQMVFQTLMKFRFLIVLDDECTVNIWLKLLRCFADAANGSRVILTTRDPNVASKADPWSPPLNLSPLTNDPWSWELLLLRNRKLRNEPDFNNFKEEILEICKGLPPAILLLGGLLSNIDSSQWSGVIQDLRFREHQSPALLKNVALMCFEKLPPKLQFCLRYFALFPKAYEIPERRLLRLWLAEEFDEMEPVRNISEDEANTYLDELVSRNMIERATRKSDGRPKTYRMPCFLHELLPRAEGDRFHAHHSRSECRSEDSERFIVKRFADQFGAKFTLQSHIRNLRSYVSFYAEKQGIYNRELGMLLKNIISGGRRVCLLLKVLDLEGVYKPPLPEKLGELRNLKYLGLRWTALESCPASIGDLSCLEAIDLKHTSITTLPSAIWKAKKLRHIQLSELSVQKPFKVSSTNQLQTLTGLFIGSKDPGEYGLDRFTSLRKLGLTCHLKSKEATASCISRLHQLKTLSLRSRDAFGQPSNLLLGPMNGLASLSKLYLFGVIADDIGNLPRNLKILTLSMSKLRQDPMPVLGKLTQLNILRLFSGSYSGVEMTCDRDDFPNLSVLKLWNLKELKKWTVKEGAMPQLLELEIRRCEQLEKSDGLEQLLALKELILTNMPPEFVENVKRRLGSKKNILLTNTWEYTPQYVSLPLHVYVLIKHHLSKYIF